MTKTLIQYRVFIGSPGGLEVERKCFKERLSKFTALHAECRDVLFHPVGWEDTLGGVGRPQALINKDLEQCDYAVFVLHDRWGSPTGNGQSSGTEEEWNLAEELYKAKKIRNIALFFKTVDAGKLRDTGPQLTKVLAFKKRIEEEKHYLFKNYDSSDVFDEELEAHLARWFRDHEDICSRLPNLSLVERSTSTASPPPGMAPPEGPGYDYWKDEASRLANADPPDGSGCLFCADRALLAASNSLEITRAKNLKAYGHFLLGAIDIAVSIYEDIILEIGAATELPLREQVAKVMVNKCITLGSLDRSADEIAVYDDVIARFGAATELPLREQVANAMVNKGITLGSLDRSVGAIAVYDELINRFKSAP